MAILKINIPDVRSNKTTRTIIIETEQLKWLLDKGYNISKYVRNKIKNDMLLDKRLAELTNQ